MTTSSTKRARDVEDVIGVVTRSKKRRLGNDPKVETIERDKGKMSFNGIVGQRKLQIVLKRLTKDELEKATAIRSYL